MKSILDRAFKYTPAVSTNLSKTFARIRREQATQLKELVRKAPIPLRRSK